MSFSRQLAMMPCHDATPFLVLWHIVIDAQQKLYCTSVQYSTGNRRLAISITRVVLCQLVKWR